MSKLKTLSLITCGLLALALSGCAQEMVKPESTQATLQNQHPKNDQVATTKTIVKQKKKETVEHPVPVKEEKKTTVATTSVATHPLDTEKAHSTTYIVQKGDSLSGIAKAHTLSLKDEIECIQKANKIAHIDDIRAGQKLVVPSAQTCRSEYLTNSK